jgi:hypothetical protein
LAVDVKKGLKKEGIEVEFEGEVKNGETGSTGN